MRGARKWEITSRGWGRELRREWEWKADIYPVLLWVLITVSNHRQPFVHQALTGPPLTAVISLQHKCPQTIIFTCSVCMVIVYLGLRCVAKLASLSVSQILSLTNSPANVCSRVLPLLSLIALITAKWVSDRPKYGNTSMQMKMSSCAPEHV